MANILTNNRFAQWTYTNSPALIKTALVLGIFGVIPGAWMVGVPILFTYGLIKKKSVATTLNQLAKDYTNAWNNIANTLGKKIGDSFTNHPASVIKFIAGFMLLTSGLNIWNLIGVYGIYRFTNDEWTATFRNRMKGLTNFIKGFFQGFGSQIFYKRLLVAGAIAAFVGLGIYSFGLLSVSMLGLGFAVIQAVTISVGVTAVLNDLVYACTNPVKAGTDNAGKIVGAWWGRNLAHRIFTGRIEGSLGPAQGYMQTGESLLFFIPDNKFIFNNTGIGLMFDRIRNLINGFLSTFLLTSQVETVGSFHGLVGPGPGTVFMFIALGCLVGYGVEKFVDSLYKSVIDDSKKGKDSLIASARANNLSYNLKVYGAFITVATPVILLSPASATLVGMAGGLGSAVALTAGAMAATFAGIHTVTYCAKRTANWLFPSKTAKKSPAVQKPTSGKTASKKSPTTQPKDKTKTTTKTKATPKAVVPKDKPAITRVYNLRRKPANTTTAENPQRNAQARRRARA